MSYFPSISVKTSDSPSVDAFARLRVSNPTTIFDSKQLYDTGSINWVQSIVGNATSSHNPYLCGVVLTASGSASSVTRQSRRYMNYQPGKSQLIIMTGNLYSPVSGVIKRIGYFDNNNGLFFQQSGSSFGVVLRSNADTGTVTDTFISQSNWNLDKLDGSGPSGFVFNQNNSQIYFTDFEWLGVGRIRYGVFLQGTPVYVHQITNYNSLPSVYMASPNLPVRYQIINNGSTPSSMLHICSTVVSEGGSDQAGVIRTVDIGGTPLSLTSGQYSALIALRLTPTSSYTANVTPLSIASLSTGNTAELKISLTLNPTTSSAFLWQSIPGSVVQYATASVVNSITNEGTKLYSTYIFASSATSNLPFDFTSTLGSDLNGNPDVLVLSVQAIGGSTTTLSSLTWRESI